MAAFAIGAATKSTPSATHGGASLAPAVTLGAPHAAITALKPGAAVPGLKQVAKKHTTRTSSSTVVTPVTQQTAPVVTQSAPPSNPVTPAQPNPPSPPKNSGGLQTGGG